MPGTSHADSSEIYSSDFSKSSLLNCLIAFANRCRLLLLALGQ